MESSQGRANESSNRSGIAPQSFGLLGQLEAEEEESTALFLASRKKKYQREQVRGILCSVTLCGGVRVSLGRVSQCL